MVTLDLSGNRLKELPENALQNLASLEVLSLAKNFFDSWVALRPNEILKPAINLKILDLSNNKFKTFGNLANQELLISPSLETLILEHCGLTSIHGRSPLKGLINLKELKLKYNPLVKIQNIISTTLKSLDASYCALSTIHHNDFAYLTSLVLLKLSHNIRLDLPRSNEVFSNSVKLLDISYCNVMYPSIQGFPNLKKAVINHNMIRSLGSNEFLNNTKLEYLDLSNNNIGSLRVDSFRGLGLLKQLDLSWNIITHMPEDSLLPMPSLTQIKLKRNFLTEVGHIKSTSLTFLDMSFCEISMIGKDSLEGLPSLIELVLSNNLIAHIPDSISSNTLKYLNLNYNRISSVSNYTFFMLPYLTSLKVVGNRFTNIWNRSYFELNPFLETVYLSDNMWRCECRDANMFDFYEYITLEPNKKEESDNLKCNSPMSVAGQTWFEACYFIWNPSEKASGPDNLIWFIIAMIVGLALCLLLVNTIRMSMKRRLNAIQAERQRQTEEARERLRQLRIRAEQEALINTPDPRDLIAPPSYDEALSMPKLNMSTHSLNETSAGKSRKKKGRRKTKSSGDLLEETERNGNLRVVDDIELADTSDDGRQQRRRRRPKRYGSHEITDLEQSPGARRRRMSEQDPVVENNVIVEVEAERGRPLRLRNRRYSSDDEPHESDF